MLDQALNQSPSQGSGGSDALTQVHAELAANQRDRGQESYLGRALSTATEWFHGADKSSDDLKAISTQIQQAEAKGNLGLANSLALGAQSAITADRKARETRSSVTSWGGEIISAVGLFMEGKAGLAVTAAAFAANSAKPDDPLSLQARDAALGSAKGLMTKGTLDLLGRTNMGIASKAVLTGSASRFGEFAFTPGTYVDKKTGDLDIGGGLGRIVGGTLDPRALASDVVVFGFAHGALGKLNSATDGLITKNRFFSTVATGGVFGFSSGSAGEIQRQEHQGESFDLGKILKAGTLRAGADAIAAIPGGLQGRMIQTRGIESGGKVNLEHDEAAARVSGLNIGRTFPGSGGREFQMVLSGGSPVSALEASQKGYSLVRVREVLANGVGPAQNLLIQHLDASTPIRAELAAKVDLIASCNPELLGIFKPKHLFPQMSGTLNLSESGSRLHFGMEPIPETNGTQWRSVKLGYPTVSELLLETDASDRLRQMHDLKAIGKEMRHFKDPARQIIDGGKDSVVIELADRRILKITDTPWKDDWGHRTFKTPDGVEHRMDARIIGEPVVLDVNGDPVRYYLQQRAKTPVGLKDLDNFAYWLERDGKYTMWDNDFSSHGAKQLGYIPLKSGRNGLVLLDYDAVRIPSEAPKKNKGHSSPGLPWLDSNYWSPL